MMPGIRAPRLLPMTISMLAVVLAVKISSVVRSAIETGQPAAFIAAAWAAGPDVPPVAQGNKSAEKPGGSSGAKPSAKPGDYGQAIRPGGGAEPPSATEVPSGPPPMTDSEKAVLLELRDRRRELDAREAAMASRESMLAAAETKLAERVDELQSLQKQLEALDASHQQQENAAWQGLVKVYETMKPRDAAVIFDELGMPVLLAVIDRMKEAKAAAILASMTPDKARNVTMQLAQLRTRGAGTADATGKPTPNTPPGSSAGSGSGAATGKPSASGS